MSQFLEGCKTAREARKRASWAAAVVKVEGGYRAFETVNDLQTWRKQK